MDSKTSMQLIAIEAYKEYLGVQLHYSKEDYDFGKFGARKCNLDTFQKRGDWDIFYKLIQKYPSKAERVKLMGLALMNKGTQPCHLMMSGANLTYRQALRYESNAQQAFMDIFFDEIVTAKNKVGKFAPLFNGESDELANNLAYLRTDLIAMAFFDIITGAVTKWAESNPSWATALPQVNKVKTFLDSKAIMKAKDDIVAVLMKQ